MDAFDRPITAVGSRSSRMEKRSNKNLLDAAKQYCTGWGREGSISRSENRIAPGSPNNVMGVGGLRWARRTVQILRDVIRDATQTGARVRARGHTSECSPSILPFRASSRTLLSCRFSRHALARQRRRRYDVFSGATSLSAICVQHIGKRNPVSWLGCCGVGISASAAGAAVR
jgi:hypothetical protein